MVSNMEGLKGKAGSVVKSLTRPFTENGAQVQNVKEARVYVFGENDITEDEINTDELNLRPRGAARATNATAEDNDPLPVDRQIEDGDTLQSISLKYGCPVSELKRLNNLIRDQDFFALKTIKVPMKRHGMLLEMIEQENSSKGGSKMSFGLNGTSETILHVSEANDGDQTDYEMNGSDSEHQELLVRKISIKGPVGAPKANHCDFLDKMDKDINHIVSSTRTRLDSLEKVVEKMTCKSIYPLQKKTSVWGGADCGMRWLSVVAIMFLIGLVTPLLYFVYYEYVKPPS